MATIDINSLSPGITFGTKGIQNVLLCVKTILTTRKGTVPLDREFGLTFEYLDDPMPVARAKLEQEIWLGIKKWEPRAILKRITFEADVMNGKLYPHVAVDVRE